MNNKGFLLVESLIASTIIIVLLIMFYIFSTRLVSIQKESTNYDTSENLYKTANIRLYLYRTSEDNVNSILDKLKGEDLESDSDDKSCISLMKKDGDILKSNITFTNNKYTDKLNKILEVENIQNLWVCDISKEYNNVSNDLKNYFMYIKKKNNSKYRLIAKHNNLEFSSVKLWRVNNE